MQSATVLFRTCAWVRHSVVRRVLAEVAAWLAPALDGSFYERQVPRRLHYREAPFRMFWRHNGAMIVHVPSVQIKNVPADVHRTLRRRAAGAGQSLQEYLLARLTEDASRPTLQEVLQRAGERAGGSVPLAEAVRAIRRDRDAR